MNIVFPLSFIDWFLSLEYDWIPWILITLVILVFIALLLTFYRSLRRTDALQDEWEYKKHSLLGEGIAEESAPPSASHPLTDAAPSSSPSSADISSKDHIATLLSSPPSLTEASGSLAGPLAQDRPVEEDTSSAQPKRWKRWSLVAGGAILGISTIWMLTQSPEKPHRAERASPTGVASAEESKTPDLTSEPLIASTSQALEYNVITSSSNPLISPEERLRFIAEALQGIRDPLARRRAAHHHDLLMSEIQRGGFHKEAWYAHVAACKQVCSPAFSGLVSHHFANVSHHIHALVFFGMGESAFDSADRRDIQHMADLLSTLPYMHHHILLIGRASKIGNHEMNMALSERRVLAVRRALTSSGIAPARIRAFWLGWEQPYLTRDIARQLHIPSEAYGDDDVKLNQSVMLVLY